MGQQHLLRKQRGHTRWNHVLFVDILSIILPSCLLPKEQKQCRLLFSSKDGNRSDVTCSNSTTKEKTNKHSSSWPNCAYIWNRINLKGCIWQTGSPWNVGKRFPVLRRVACRMESVLYDRPWVLDTPGAGRLLQVADSLNQMSSHPFLLFSLLQVLWSDKFDWL